MSEKIYIGRGKKVGQYGTIAVSICIDDIPKEHITKASNGKRYLNINIAEKREVDQYGYTHSVAVDTWKPEAKPQPKPQPATRPAPADDSSDLPF